MADEPPHIALVTGASRGLGAAIAHRLAVDGWTVAVNGIVADETTAVAHSIVDAGGSAAPFIADVTDEAAVTAMVDDITSTLGPVTCLVLNATGPQPDGDVDGTGWPETLDELDFFVRSPLIVGTAVLPGMRAAGHGRIVHIDSEVVSKTPANRVAYTTAKAAQVGLARSWAVELAPEGITVNSVAPGFVPVERHDNVAEVHREAYRSTVPMGAMGTAADVAAAVAFFASDEARFITGQRLLVDGGRSLG